MFAKGLLPRVAQRKCLTRDITLAVCRLLTSSRSERSRLFPVGHVGKITVMAKRAENGTRRSRVDGRRSCVPSGPGVPNSQLLAGFTCSNLILADADVPRLHE